MSELCPRPVQNVKKQEIVWKILKNEWFITKIVQKLIGQNAHEATYGQRSSAIHGLCRKSSNPASFYSRRMSTSTGFLTHFPCVETEDFRKFCRGGRLCPPAEKSRFYENLRRIRTAKGRKAASAPRVYLKTPNAPGQRVFSRCAAPFFLEIRQYSCGKMSCAT